MIITLYCMYASTFMSALRFLCWFYNVAGMSLWTLYSSTERALTTLITCVQSNHSQCIGAKVSKWVSFSSNTSTKRFLFARLGQSLSEGTAFFSLRLYQALLVDLGHCLDASWTPDMPQALLWFMNDACSCQVFGDDQTHEQSLLRLSEAL